MDDIVRIASGAAVLVGLACLATMVVSVVGIAVYLCFSIVTDKWVN